MVVPAADGGAARGSVPSFGTPERAVAALAHAVRYGSWLTSPAGSVPDLPGIDADAARTLLADAWELISAPRAAPLLDGYWGARVIAREPLIDLALRLSTLAGDLPEVSDLELRPVLAGPAGVAVTSGTARIGPALTQPHIKRRLH